ncbi:MAG TPA: hypothetical protein VJB14_07725 [Planctomycetota bacterium]|nr:hypothetical protein [Planctomycetota bacterium]
MVTVIFWLPLALSVVGTGYFIHFTEMDRKWKVLSFLVTGTSLGLQLVPQHVHFTIPLILQTLMGVWVIVYWKLDR